MGAEDAKQGKVTVCTARDCKWNDAAQCMAEDGVMVNFHLNHADCNTYTQNEHIPGQAGAAEF